MRYDMDDKFLESHSRKSDVRKPRNSKKMRITEDQASTDPNHSLREILNSMDQGYVGTNFNLLRRFLKSRVGVLWDDVYSEICSTVDKRAFKGHHLHQWLKDCVQMNCYIKDDILYDQNDIELKPYSSADMLYIHPETLKLESLKCTRKRRVKKNVKKVFELDGRHFLKKGDIWYRVKMSSFEDRDDLKKRFNNNDMFLIKKYYSWDKNYFYRIEQDLVHLYGRDPKNRIWYCAERQCANSREIEKLKKKYTELDSN